MTRTKKRILLGAMLLLLLFSSGCMKIRSGIHDLKGSIIGNSYTIDTFDNFGERVLRTTGKRIDIDPNVVEEYAYDSDGGWIKTQALSSVITITVDGKQLISCGDTCIFYEDGLVPDYEFYLENIASQGHGGLSETTLIAGKVNEVKNFFGKAMVVVIKSQTGAPIYAFSGNRVYWEIPEDLPKFTKLMIDGKALYIHRANFQIVDKKLL
ncbi:MAG: DUF5052 family protein [Blautia sp.]|nr:DUF5052 family protein [Blautia sp.]